MSKRGLIKISGPLKKGRSGKGQLIPSLPLVDSAGKQIVRKREERFWNFARDENGQPYGEKFEKVVPDGPYVRKLIRKGEVKQIPYKPGKATPKPDGKAAKGGKK